MVPKKPTRHRYKYDVFISYSVSDKRWVYHDLRPQLEKIGISAFDPFDEQQLYNILINRFSLAELQGLCFNLNVGYEDLEGTTTSGKARELIWYMKRHGRLQRLAEECYDKRQNIFEEESSRTITQCRTTLLVLSPTYVERNWQTVKTILARKSGGPPVDNGPVILTIIEPCELPASLHSLRQVDFTKDEHAWESLTSMLLQERLRQHYDEAEVARKAEQWSQAIDLYEQILRIDANYHDAKQKLAEAKEQILLSQLYQQAEQAMAEEQWSRAIDLYEQILRIDANYHDAKQRLADAEKQKKLSPLYDNAEQAVADEQWLRAINLFEQILKVDSSYRDAKQRLSEAEARKQEKLDQLYQKAERAMAARLWTQAISLYGQVTRLDENYQDARQKLAQAKQARLRRIGILLILVLAVLAGALFVISRILSPPSVSVESFTIVVDDSRMIVEPGARIEAMAGDIITVRAELSETGQIEEGLLFVWYTCLGGEAPILERIDNPEMLYAVPDEADTDCVRVAVERRDQQLDKAEIFVDVEP